MSTGFLPSWALFACTLLLFLLFIEAGHRVGTRRQHAAKHEKEGPVGAMVAATLGLLGFFLAFTFGVAGNLFIAKRDVMLDEANSIGTAYLRADFLPEAEQEVARKLLREYVDARIAAAETGDVEPAMRRSPEIHRELWALAAASMNEQPTSIAAGLFTQSLNEVIDLHTTRVLIALRSSIPDAIWIALYAVAFLALVTMGYYGGLSATSRPLAVLTVAVAFAALFWLIHDLDTTREGPLRISQQTMLDLRESMGAP